MKRSNKKKIVANLLKLTSHDISVEDLTKKGFWSLPIPFDLGGYNVGWSECISILRILIPSIKCTQAISQSISTLSNLYIVLKCGNVVNKKSLIPSLLSEGNDVNLKEFIINLSVESKVEYLNFKRLIYGLIGIDVAINIVRKFNHINIELKKDKINNQFINKPINAVLADINASRQVINDLLANINLRSN